MVRFILVMLSALPLIMTLCLSQTLGTGAASLAGSVSVVPKDRWSMVNNPGVLAELRTVSVSSFFSPEEYGLSELRTIAASAVIPTVAGVFGLAVEQFGFDLYKEAGLVVGLGGEIADGFNGGASVRYRRLVIKGYGTDHAAFLQAGTLVNLGGDFFLGFVATNITGTTIGRHRERLPQTVATGVRFESDEHFLAIIEMEKDARYPAAVKIGVRQQFLGAVDISAGFSEHPQKVSAGVEVHGGWMHVGWAGDAHPVLGWTHQLEVTLDL